jgi:hypothetical protein
MTAIRKKLANPLASILGYRRGLSLEAATAAAEANLARIQHDCLASLDQALGVIYQQLPKLDHAENPAQAETIYQAANQVLALGAHCQLAALGKAAFCLCELIDRSRMRGQWSRAALETHLQALKLLRSPPANTDPKTEAAIIAGLFKVIEKTSR